MNVQSPKAERRRRRAPQRIVAHQVEERERKPFVFGWGADLTQRERESLKERIALFAGIAIAVVVIGLIGWGAVYDNIITPANQRAANNKPIAIVGNYTITTGFFKAFEQLQNTNLNSQLQQDQAQLAQLQADPKKNAAQISQYQQAISQMQSQQSSLAQDTLNVVINDQIAIQRGASVGYPPNAKAQNAALQNQIKATGGPRHFQQFVQQSGLTMTQMKMLLLGEYLQAKIQAKIEKQVPHVQTEVRASHILISAKNKKLALKVYHLALGGANFAALAKKYSTDPGSAKKGGDLGYFAHGTMVAPFDKAAFAMKLGQIRLVKSQFGWHIIKLTGREQKKLSATAYQQAQASAYSDWLNKQKSILHVQNIVAPTSLPAVATATPNPLSQIPPQAIPTAAAPAPTAGAASTATTGKSGTGSTTGKSGTSTGSTGKSTGSTGSSTGTKSGSSGKKK